MTTLKDLAVGESATVVAFKGTNPSYRRKLLTMGVTPGARIDVTRVAPLGDPVEIRVRGVSISVRKEDAESIFLEKV